MKNLVFILFLTIICFCYSQERYVYLVEMENFVCPYSIGDLSAKGIHNINVAGGQPFRLTQLTIPNTVYVQILITPRDNDEKIVFKALDTNYDFITKISSGNVITKQTRFGNIQIWDDFKFNDLPEDFYKDFSVVGSTP